MEKIIIFSKGNEIRVKSTPKSKFLSDTDNQLILENYGLKINKTSDAYEGVALDPTTTILDLKVEFEDGYEIKWDGDAKPSIQKRENTAINYNKFITEGRAIKKKKNHNIKLVGFKKGFQLKPYQKKPVNHLLAIPNCANFSIPGSGKTLMTYAGFFILKQKKLIDKLWIVGPRASFEPWMEEYEKWTGNKAGNDILVYDGSIKYRKKLRKRLLKIYDIVLMPYGIAANDRIITDPTSAGLGSIIGEKKVLLVLDESHRIKTIEETTEKENLTSANSMILLGQNATRRCILTGTPMPHEPPDLWSQVTFLWPDVKPLGERSEFEQRIQDEHEWIQCQRDIDFLWTRVTNKQMEKDLPKKKIHDTGGCRVKMDDTQEKIYSIIETQLNEKHGRDRELVRRWKSAKTVRLMQASSNPRLLAEKDPVFELPALTAGNSKDTEILRLVKTYKKKYVPPKIKKVAELARKLSNDKKNVIIFTVFRGNVRLLAKLLADLPVVWVYGNLKPKDETARRIQEFKSWDEKTSSGGMILIATAGTLAESVSLHRYKDKHVCNNVIFLERSYDAGKYMQALHRVYRIGSDKKKTIHYYCFMSELHDSSDTLDHRIHMRLTRRLDALYDLMEDEWKLDKLSLDPATVNGKKQFYGENDDLDDILKNVDDMTKKRKKSRKP